MYPMAEIIDIVDEIFGQGNACDGCEYFSYHYEPEGRYRQCFLLEHAKEHVQDCPALTDQEKDPNRFNHHIPGCDVHSGLGCTCGAM